MTSPNLSRIYFLEGHQETSLEENLFKLKSKIESEAGAVESLNLIKSGGVPEDADAVVVVSPKRDLSTDERTLLQNYLAKGGKALFLFDVLGPDTELTNFKKLLEYYGIGIENNFVVEEDSYSFYSDNKMFLVPYYESHSIVDSLNSESLAIIFPYTLRLEELKTDDRNLIIEPLLKTSEYSWARYNLTDATASKTTDDISDLALWHMLLHATTLMTGSEIPVLLWQVTKFIENNMLDIQGILIFHELCQLGTRQKRYTCYTS